MRPLGEKWPLEGNTSSPLETTIAHLGENLLCPRDMFSPIEREKLSPWAVEGIIVSRGVGARSETQRSANDHCRPWTEY